MRISVRATVAIAALALVSAGCGGGSHKTSTGPGYHFKLPAHWHRQTHSVPAGEDAVYVRNDHTALLTIRTEPRVPVISKRFIRGLDAEFGRRLKGYVPLAHRILVTKAGPVFYFSYTQKHDSRLTSIILVPAHGHSFVLDAVSNPKSKAATRDIASIFHTFVPH